MATKRVMLFIILLVFFHFTSSHGNENPDAEILIRFRDSLENVSTLSEWSTDQLPCNGSTVMWRGVLCDHDGRVWGLKLENLGLSGVFDVEALAELPYLRTISLMHNNIEGSLPNMTKIGSLKSIYLSFNKFYGEIAPTTFSGMNSLKKLHIASNEFSGPIPITLAAMPKLRELHLENNGFQGELPDFHIKLTGFNVSNNSLMGPIPLSLSHFNTSSFAGNNDLCGTPLKACPERNASMATKIVIGVLVAAALAALIAVVIILLRNKPSRLSDTTAIAGQPDEEIGKMEQGITSIGSTPEHGKQGAKLTFLREDIEKFDMLDLLKASAEILGSGVFGSTYKASLDQGKVMVVKRFRHMNNVNREEFNEHLWRLGRLSHQNVLSIVAFYYRKEEKLLVADYMENGSLAAQLHGKRANPQTQGHSSPLNWSTRLGIIKGVAEGLHYLYKELPSLTAPHGHLKSSNVLLDGNFRPVLSDYGFVPVVNQDHAPDNMIAYKSPEYKITRRITKKTDVWSFGILILEIITGRIPPNVIPNGEGDADFVAWVESALENDAAELFDSDMDLTDHNHGEIVKLLKIGLSCCMVDPEQRPDIREVVESIDEIKEMDGEDDFYSVYTSEADKRSARGLSDDFKTINI